MHDGQVFSWQGARDPAAYRSRSTGRRRHGGWCAAALIAASTQPLAPAEPSPGLPAAATDPAGIEHGGGRWQAID